MTTIVAPAAILAPMSAQPALGARSGVRGAAAALLAAVRAAVAVVLVAAIGIVLAGVAPTFFGAESFTVYSGSMEPAVKVGALAVVRPQKSTDLKPGDIITYRTPTQPDVIVTHRLVSVVRTPEGRLQFRTKGDANSVEDLVLVDDGAVLGKVIYSVPYAGHVVEFSKRPLGRLALLGLPLVLLGLDYLRQRLRRDQLARPAAGVAGDGPAPADRVAALLERGQAALDAGHVALAQRAAEGALALDPRNEDAWLLRAYATVGEAERRQQLRTALLLNPDARRIAAALAALEAGDTGLPDPHDRPGRSSLPAAPKG